MIEDASNATLDLDDATPILENFSSSIYTLLGKIGEGGFGQVFKAVNNKTKQIVAIKLLTLNPEFDDSKRSRYIERFEREMLLGSHLQHPNIVRLLDKGQSGDELIYAVFEYIEGQSLKERLFELGPLEPVEAAELMAQVLDALVHAHSLGIVHRDIKPANIMLTNTGAKIHAKILDFGIGALVNEARQLDYKTITLTQETLGTPSYSAPEQLRGEPPTPKTDLYVWGLVLIECLTGAPAISGSSLASIFQKQLNPVSVPLPPALVGHPVADLLRRVLNKKVNDRSGSALEVYRDFTALNFATLVGDIGQVFPRNSPSDLSRGSSSVGETLVGTENFLYSGLTERKQITVMCIKLSLRSFATELLDHEVVNTLHRDKKAQCVDVAQRYGATYVGALGNTLLFYFGYPSSSDNDGRLCARAALELVSLLTRRNALTRYSLGVVAEASIGIHSGLVTVYADALPEGDTPDIAMSLSQAAQANQILCSEATRKILESYIEFEPAKTMVLGVDAKETALFSLTGERLVEAFGFLRASHRHRSFIGREKELEMLKSLLLGTDKKAAHVYGEAGIGKSRLVFELRNNASEYTHFVAQCLPEYKNNALYPILTILKYKYSLDALKGDAAVKRLQGILEGQVAIDAKQAIAVLCAWLNLTPPEGLAASASLSPEELKQVLFKAVTYLLCRRDDSELNNSSLFLFEDMHWADPTSIEFIQNWLVSDIFLDSGHVFVSTSREHLPQSLVGVIHCLVAVDKLSANHSSEFISHLFDRQKVSATVTNTVVSRTDGIPLFIEELVSMLKQKELVHFVNAMVDFVDANSVIEVPNSLRDSLQQNLDRLGSAKDTAQLASAIGREFSHELMVQCAHQDEAQLQLALNELLNAELIYVQRRVGGDSYIFKHALVRDAAYESMPPTRRKEMHRQIAVSLSLAGTGAGSDNTGLLAMHWGQAGVYDKAIEYGNIAANSALKRTSSDEVITQAMKIQEWIDHLDVTAQIDAKLTNYGLLTSAYMETKGWASDEVLKYSEASINLLKSTDRTDELVSRLWWKMLNSIVSGRRQQLDVLSRELEDLIATTQNINKAAIKCIQGFYYFSEGDRRAAIAAFVRAIEYYGQPEDMSHQQIYGFDVGAYATVFLARAYADIDEQEKAYYYAELAVTQARSHANIPTLGLALMYHAIVHQQYNNHEEVIKSAGELISIADELNLPVYKGYGQMQYDWAVGNPSQASNVLTDLINTGSRFALGQFFSFYADAYANLNEHARALDIIEQSLALDQSINEPYYTSFLLLKKVQYSLCLPNCDKASLKLVLAQAENIAREQGATFVLNRIPQTSMALVKN